jgi:WD40 repeat protein
MNLTKHWAVPVDDYVIDLAWSPDGALLAVASAAGPIHIFDTATGRALGELPGHEGGSNALAFAPVGPGTTGASSLLASGGQDGQVKLWEPAHLQHLATAPLGSGWVEHLGWRPLAPKAGAGHLLAATCGRTLSFVRADGTLTHTTVPAPKTYSALAWQPAAGCVAAAYFGGVQLWDADDFIRQKELPYANGIHALAWSPDNRWLVSGNQDPSVHLWLPEQDEEFHMSGYESKVKELSFDRTGRWLATGGGRDACIWDCSGRGPEGREPTMLPHDGRVCALGFQNAHSLLATAGEDGVLHLWSVDRRQPLRATVRMPHPATRVAWSPNDDYLAVGNDKGLVYVLHCQD